MEKLLAALLAASLAAGCGQKEEGTAASSTPAKTAGDKPAADPAKAAEKPAEGGGEAAQKALAEAAGKIEGAQELANAAKDVKALAEGGGPELTLEQYEKLMLGLSACTVTEHGIDYKCEALKAFEEARRNRGNLMKGLGGQLAGLGQKHIKHESPAVRIQAANLMGSLFGANKDSQKTIVDAASAEQDPMVLKHMLRTVRSSIGENADVLALVMKNAGHTEPKVRLEAVFALTSTWAKGTEGTLEKAMEMAEKDADADVRQYACRGLGARGDEKVLPLLEKHTKDANADPKMYAACLEGLISMWSGPLTPEAPNEKAYKMTLERLKATPRSENNPPWSVLSSLQWAKREDLTQKAPFVKKEELIGLLGEIVGDRGANWMARTGAIDTMAKLGADKTLFEKHKKAYEEFKDKPGVDKFVYSKLEKALAGEQ